MERINGSGQLQQPLRQRIFTEPISRHTRPYLIRYIKLRAEDAKKLSRSQLHGDEGHDIAMDICGALAFQSAEGVESDGWLNPQDEPQLSRLLDISSALDEAPNKPENWRQLFSIIAQIE